MIFINNSLSNIIILAYINLIILHLYEVYDILYKAYKESSK